MSAAGSAPRSLLPHINVADYRTEWSTLPPFRRESRQDGRGVSTKTIRRFICDHCRVNWPWESENAKWGFLIYLISQRSAQVSDFLPPIVLQFLEHFPQLFIFAIKFQVPSALFSVYLNVRDIAFGGVSERNWATHDCIFDWHTWGWMPPSAPPPGPPKTPNPHQTFPWRPLQNLCHTTMLMEMMTSRRRKEFSLKCWRVLNDFGQERRQIRKWFAHQPRLQSKWTAPALMLEAPYLINHTLSGILQAFDFNLAKLS